MNEQFVYSQKNNFSGGELTPTMEGRTELALYQNGVKKLMNFIITPSGGIMRRPPTQFVYLFDNTVPKKMVTLMFSRQLSYLLVFEAHPLETRVSVFVDGKKNYLYNLAFSKDKLAANNSPAFVELVKGAVLKEQADCRVSGEDDTHYYLEISIDDLRPGKKTAVLNSMKAIDDESQQMLRLTAKEQQLIVKRLVDVLAPNSDEALDILIQACTELGNLAINISPAVRYEVDCHNLSFALESYRQDKADAKEDLMDEKVPAEWLSVKYISEIMAQHENPGHTLLSSSPPVYPAHEVTALGTTAVGMEHSDTEA